MQTKIMGSNMNKMMGKGMMMNNGMGMMDMPMTQMNMMMIPRMEMKMEKCENGMKMMCMSKDETAASMMQNLCSMLSGGMTSMCMMMNGMKMMECNMMMGMCKCEMATDGMCMTWTSGDEMMSSMIHRCCDCMMSMMECGCNAVMCMNNTPVCCC
ncbi:hypothetical protein [Clostridium arbusti]|uniref:hypothetical protein n=1 Tax=Clostridium arbusti TaxID=1137848 RepID=UPI000288B392|nr:hypothetical protein [Clostridium arbusti]